MFVSNISMSVHNILKPRGFVHVAPENVTMGCPNLVQIQKLI
jgi:hypothetical protein